MSARVRDALPAGRSELGELWLAGVVTAVAQCVEPPEQGRRHRRCRSSAVSWSERLDRARRGARTPPMAGSPRPGLLLGSACRFSGCLARGIRDRTPLMRPRGEPEAASWNLAPWTPLRSALCGVAIPAVARVRYDAWVTQSGEYRLSSIGSRLKSVRSSGQSSAWAKRPSQSRVR